MLLMNFRRCLCAGFAGAVTGPAAIAACADVGMDVKHTAHQPLCDVLAPNRADAARLLECNRSIWRNAFNPYGGNNYKKIAQRALHASSSSLIKPRILNEHCLVCMQRESVVYFLDYTGPVGFPEAIATTAGRVVVLDHHKTAQDSLVGRSDLPENLDVTIDMNRSGATISRDYFQSIQVAH